MAGGGVDDEHDAHGHGRALAGDGDDLLELAHEVGAGVQAPGGVDEHEVATEGLCALEDVVAHGCRVCAALALDHLDAAALSPDIELLDRRCAEGVRTADERPAPLGEALVGQLSHGGRLAGAVDAHEEHADGALLEEVLLGLGEQTLDGLGQQVQDRVGVWQGLARRSVPQALHDLCRCLGAHVCEDQGLLELVPEVVVDFRAALEQDVHALGQALAGPREALSQ